MNITEFAKLAGVSKSAVSRYFNHGYLSPDKQQKIEQALQQHDYTPSVQARSVRTKVTKLVGVILPKLTSEGNARVVEGVAQVLGEQGYELLLVNTANDAVKEVKYLELFRQNRVDGVILLASVFTELHRRMLGKMNIPVVIVGQSYKGGRCVCHDDFGAARALTALMLDRGAQRPACLTVLREDLAAGQARYDGYCQALREHGLAPEARYEATVGFEMESGYQGAARLLAQTPRPDGLFCATDTIATGAMLYCREQGIAIPGQVMLASVGDGKVGRLTYAPLTTAHLHYKTAGIEAAEMLLGAIRRPDAVPRELRLDYQVVERESTAR